MDRVIQVFLFWNLNYFITQHNCSSVISFSHNCVPRHTNGIGIAVVYVKCYEVWKEGVLASSDLLWLQVLVIHSGKDNSLSFEMFRRNINNYFDFHPTVKLERNLTMWMNQQVVKYILPFWNPGMFQNQTEKCFQNKFKLGVLLSKGTQ